MKILIFSIFIFTSVTIFAQPPNYDATCEEGKLKAIEDAQKDQYYLYAYGLILMNPRQNDKNDFGEKYLKDNFGIHLGLGGCVVTDGGDCYGDKMTELISDKFGDNFFDSINPIIDSLYAINVQERIDNDVIFDYFDSEPGFLNDVELLNENISYLIHPDSLNNIKGKIIIRGIITKNGELEKIEVIRGINDYYDNICIRAIMDIKKWKPAILNGQKVSSRISIPINFN